METIPTAQAIEVDCKRKMAAAPQPPPRPQHTLVWIVLAALAVVLGLAVSWLVLTAAGPDLT
jgi:hypothetical protein